METDPGSEFKSEFAEHLKSKAIMLRHGKTGRHRQQSVVENRNYAIGYALNLRMVSIEEVTGQTSRDWVSFLPTVIEALNEQAEERYVKRKTREDGPYQSGKSNKTLEVGTRVRVILEEPVDNVTDAKLHGKFRAGDKRWDSRIRKVYQTIIRRDQPFMYLITKPNSDTPESVAYTIEQLQEVRSDEREIDARKLNIPKNNQDFRVHSIVGKKKEKNKIFYRVRWIGFAEERDWTWEPRANLMTGGEGVKKKIKDYDEKHQ